MPIVSVQNKFNPASRDTEDVLEHAARAGIAFIPFVPLATGSLMKEGSPLSSLSIERNLPASQLALACLLKRSPVILPIPGTSQVAHLEENVGSAGTFLSDEEFAELDRLS